MYIAVCIRESLGLETGGGRRTPPTRHAQFSGASCSEQGNWKLAKHSRGSPEHPAFQRVSAGCIFSQGARKLPPLPAQGYLAMYGGQEQRQARLMATPIAPSTPDRREAPGRLVVSPSVCATPSLLFVWLYSGAAYW